MSQMFCETIIQCDGTIYVHVAQMNADRCALSAAEYAADRNRSVNRLREELSRREKENEGKNNELYKLVNKCPNEKIHFQYYNSRNLLCNKEEKIGFTQTNSKESQVLKTNLIKTKLGMWYATHTNLTVISEMLERCRKHIDIDQGANVLFKNLLDYKRQNHTFNFLVVA